MVVHTSCYELNKAADNGLNHTMSVKYQPIACIRVWMPFISYTNHTQGLFNNDPLCVCLFSHKVINLLALIRWSVIAPN